MNYQEAYTKLEKYGQLHVLKYYDELGEEEKETLLAQIEQTDFEVLSLCEQKESLNLRGKIEPIAVMQLPEIAEKKEEYTKTGLEAIRAGKVGAVLLGWRHGHKTRLRRAERRLQYRTDKGCFYLPASDRESDGRGGSGGDVGAPLCDDQ